MVNDVPLTGVYVVITKDLDYKRPQPPKCVVFATEDLLVEWVKRECNLWKKSMNDLDAEEREDFDTIRRCSGYPGTLKSGLEFLNWVWAESLSWELISDVSVCSVDVTNAVGLWVRR